MPLYVKEKIRNVGTDKQPKIIFSISGCEEGATLSWQVTGVRQDRFALANPVIPEVNKDKPGYIHPDLFQDMM
mgnify:CR=1 FL=1